MQDKNFDHDDEQSNEDFAAMLEESLGSTTRLELGQKTDATILQIGPDWMFLDIGQKGEGVLAVHEFQNEDGELTVAVGDRISAYFVSREGGEMRFTTRIGGGSKGNEQLEEAWRSGIPVEGRVEKEIKGGYEVKLPGNIRAFCPYSQISLRRLEKPEEVIDKTFPFKITQFEEQGRNVVISRRDLLEEERREQRDALKETLKEGMRVQGEITSLRDFGAFVDIGGIEGLLPISEIAYGRIEDINDILRIGQRLELVIKRIDWAENKFSFSLRDTLADPWAGVPTKYPAGAQISGKVSRLTEFGAFITLEEGIDGLVHISKLGEGRRINHPREVLSLGQDLGVTVEKVDLEQRRISLVPAGTELESEEKSYTDQSVIAGMGTFADLLRSNPKGKRQKQQ
ncbi:30S ribosomal protein S1 [Geopsychrobacter electrodiphilus]|uniref:30S ribosomal protein S1 n=1 Tax=Geopsychrobacter electrodiphilus TaxID=225196 RepID=UPI00036CC8DC|nr:30S ribosomal protein S1 [Geopsychrobacter electrodiphilus]